VVYSKTEITTKVEQPERPPHGWVPFIFIN
jgi:hypothetical protein